MGHGHQKKYIITISIYCSTKRCSYLVLQHVKTRDESLPEIFGSPEGTKIVSDETPFIPNNSLPVTKVASAQSGGSLLEDVFDV